MPKTESVFDLSKNNWRNHWAAMRDGLVIAWIPQNEEPPFNMVTSGMRWKSYFDGLFHHTVRIVDVEESAE